MRDVFTKDFNVIYTRVVQGCNLNCDHCFTLGNKDPMEVTQLDLIERYYRVLRERINPKKAVFYIHGGETFIAPLPFLKKVNNLIRTIFDETKFDIIPQTNLSFPIDDTWIQFIKDEYRGTIGVSWDADIRFKSKRLEDRFFSNLKRLIDAGVHVHIAITVQRHLLKRNPLDVIAMFDGVDSIDFELLTQFDEKTRDLKVNNVEWSNWIDQIAEYYQNNPTTWSLPLVDLMTRSIQGHEFHDCKCNCCDRRTFTFNPNGTVGLCPDRTYVAPLGTVKDLEDDWEGFEARASEEIIGRLAHSVSHENCFTCEHYDVCGGNCEESLFDDTEECPMSKKTVSRIRNNLPTFIKLYEERALVNLTELRQDYE